MDRSAREVSVFDSLDTGDHVAWITRHSGEFEWLADKCLNQGATAGDKLLLLGRHRRTETLPSLGGEVTVLDPGQAFFGGDVLDADAMFGVLRDQDALARREGYRGIRMVADMDWLSRVPADFVDVVDFEQRLDRLVTDTGAVVVCAYRPENFDTTELDRLLSVHPHIRDPRPAVDGFRIWYVGGDRWRVAGDVDVNTATEFRARLASAASGSDQLIVDLRTAGFIDVAGLRALAACGGEERVPVVVEGLGAAMRRCWDLLDFAAVAPNVEVQA